MLVLPNISKEILLFKNKHEVSIGIHNISPFQGLKYSYQQMICGIKFHNIRSILAILKILAILG